MCKRERGKGRERGGEREREREREREPLNSRDGIPEHPGDKHLPFIVVNENSTYHL